MKKNQLSSIVCLSITLFACGGSGSGSVDGSPEIVPVIDTTKEVFIKKISATSWVKKCFHTSSKYLTIPEDSFISITISIDPSLESNTSVEVFSESTCSHHSVTKRLTFTDQIEIGEKVITEESINAYGINTFFVKSPDFTELPPSYSLIYLNSERLYYGKATGENLGQSKETRHSSISLDDYFSKVVN